MNWMNEVWQERKEPLFNRKGLLICDSMRASITDFVKKYLQRIFICHYDSWWIYEVIASGT